MKRAWMVVFLMLVVVAPAVALAQAPVGAWCGGSYGSPGTNFGECVSLGRDPQLAGRAAGLGTGTLVPTRPEQPSVARDRSGEVESPGND
jgi:hypothetical protein